MTHQADQLVIETAANACSVALVRHGDVIARHHDALVRGHAELLLPRIAALPDQGRAKSIWVDCGPGSFTGVRVGMAAARALGFAWNVPVMGFCSLDLLAQGMASAHPEATRFLVAIIGGHGEYFVQAFSCDTGAPVADAPFRSLTPAAALEAHGVQPWVVGNAAQSYVERAAGGNAVDMMMDAGFAATLDPARCFSPVTAIYGRAPDAKPLAQPAPLA